MYGAGTFLLDSIHAWFRSLQRAAASIAHYLDPVIAPVNRFLARVGFFLGRFLGPLDRITIVYPTVVAAGLTLLMLLLAPNVYFNLLRDQGYLWYGAQRVLAGEVPFRDFQTYYDPARYYLSAAGMAVLGNHGIMALWKVTALFGVITTWIASQLIFRKTPRPSLWLVLTVTVTMFMWMFPESYKLLDIATSLALVALLAWLIEQPTPFRCFVAGAGLGLAAIVGRNHALYGVLTGMVALGCVTLVEKRARLLPAFLYCAAGVLAGYLPMLLALAFVPGLWAPFWDGIRLYFVLGTTNLPIPVPWPWHVPPDLPLVEKLRYVIVGVLLIAQPLFGLAVVGYSLWRSAVRKIPVNPLLFASALLAIAYTHHAFARAGLSHLAQAIYPLLVALFIVVMSKSPGTKIALATIICALSVFVEWRAQPRYVFEPRDRNMAPVQVGMDTLWFGPSETRLMQGLDNLVNKYAPDGREFVAVPYIPALYAMFDRRAAVWGSYLLSPASQAEQEREIKRIEAEHPAFVLVEVQQQDGRAALAYWHTNNLVFEYVLHHYKRVDDPDVPGRMMLYVPPDPNQPAP